MGTRDPINRRSAWRRLVRVFGFALFFAVLACARVYGDVGLVLNESLDTSVSRITGSGHSAVYLSRICPESPVKVRLCRPGEEGSVISNYTTLGEDQPYEWNVVSLSLYLYGVEDPRNRPLFGSEKIKQALEERYREKYLSEVCTSETCLKSGKAEWREMVAATISRNVYIFVMKTSVEQDEQLIAELNSGPNQNHFNGVTRNCATFARHVINTYFGDAIRPNYINDFGMTSPKAIARSFTRYASKHPGSEFHVLHFAQVPGTYKRSSVCREGTEQLYRSKKLLVPMLIFAPHELPFMAASYTLTGRFNPEHEFEQFPTEEAFDLNQDMKAAQRQSEPVRADELHSEEGQERADAVGTAKEWKEYREAFEEEVRRAVAEEVIPGQDYLERLFKRLDQRGVPVVDDNGTVWIQLPEAGIDSRVGVSGSNLLAAGSDAQLANQFVLARINYVLSSPSDRRETWGEFKTDWALLDRAQVRGAEWAARAPQGPGAATTAAESTTETRARSSKRSAGDD